MRKGVKDLVYLFINLSHYGIKGGVYICCQVCLTYSWTPINHVNLNTRAPTIRALQISNFYGFIGLDNDILITFLSVLRIYTDIMTLCRYSKSHTDTGKQSLKQCKNCGETS